MASKRRSQVGLAARLVRVTLAVGVFTVSAAGIASLVSTSRLTAEKAQGRSLLTLQVIEDGVESELRDVERVLAQATQAAVAASETPAGRAEVEAALTNEDIMLLDAYVAKGNGEVIASLQGGDRLSDVGELGVFLQAREGRGGFFAYVPSAGAARQLWFARTAVRANGNPIFLIARVDTRFLDVLMTEVQSTVPDRSVAILDGTDVIQSAEARRPLRLASAQWSAETSSTGRLTVMTTGGMELTGVYNDLQGPDGVSWRVVIAEPADIAARDTVAAVAPLLGVLVAGGTIGLLAAWGLSQRLVRPLRQLESTALSAAAGAYVKPLSADSDDEIGRVAEAFNALALRLNALHDLSRLLASASQVDQVLDGILSAMGHIVGPGAAAIYLLDATGLILWPARTRGIDLASAQPVELRDEAWLGQALYAATPTELEGDAEQIAAALPGLQGSHTAVLAAPLVAGKAPLGVVIVLRDGAHPVSEAEQEMVQTFSAQAAVAVNTSRLFQEESESRRVAEALKSVAEELVRHEGLDAALSRVEMIVRDVLGAVLARIVVVDRRILGLPPEPRARDSELLAVGLRALSRGDGGAIVLGPGEDMAVDSVLHEFDAAEVLVVPISLETEHGAVMIAALPNRDAGGSSLAVAQGLADEIELALDNAYFYERALTRASNLETIFRISQAVGSSLQVNVVLNRVLDVVQKILSADAVALLSYDARKRSLTTAMARGAVPPGVLHAEVRPGEDIPGYVFQSGEPIAVRDLHTGMEGVAGSAADNDLGSLLAVPLLARGRSIGVLMVFSAHRGAFSDEDMNVLQTFASQAALALDTARLYSREHEVATVLQQSILPDALPDFPEVTAASVYAPAGGEAEIGGDYYDLFRARDGAIWIAIADVCGKGIQAATKTSMIKYSVRALVAAGLSPGRVLAEVNRMTTEAGDPSDIVTVWVGRYDARTEELVWADGGHPPGLLKRTDGSFEQLGATGPLLGALADAEYEEETVRVNRGDQFLLYTDGVTEARRGETFFGEERVRTSFSESVEPSEAAGNLLQSVRSWVKGDLRDDVAVLVIAVHDEDSKGTTTNERRGE